jgi:hypothetical protein
VGDRSKTLTKPLLLSTKALGKLTFFFVFCFLFNVSDVSPTWLDMLRLREQTNKQTNKQTNLTAHRPAIEAEGGSIAMTLQPGRHTTVNGKRLLTEEEVAEVVSNAVAAALKSVAQAMV